MKVVFADAFYFVARLNLRDQHHERVLEFSRDFRARILTSDWVLMEVADGQIRIPFARSRFHIAPAPDRTCEIVPASRELLDRALDLYHQHTDKEWTLTDCVSFVIMRDQNVSDALTGDKHFEQAGFAALLK